MKTPPPNLGTGQHPFPHQRKSPQAQSADDFMHEHGSSGAQFLFRLSELFNFVSVGKGLWMTGTKRVSRALRLLGETLSKERTL